MRWAEEEVDEDREDGGVDPHRVVGVGKSGIGHTLYMEKFQLILITSSMIVI